MNQFLANRLNEEGAIILILNMQKGAEIGIDYNSWCVGENFLGFKMVNPGFHCLFYSSVNSDNEYSVRTIIPLFVQTKEVLVLEWDAKEEQLKRESDIDAEIVRKYKLAGAQFFYDKNTASYPFETIGKWLNMTNYITKSLFDQLTDNTKISFILDTGSEHIYNYSETINISYPKDIQVKLSDNDFAVSPLSMLYIDSSTELTRLSLSYHSKYPYSCVLGEMQFAFIMFHIGQNYESLLQWKNLLFLITGAADLLTRKNDISISSFYDVALKTILLQLSELGDDFFSLIDGNDGPMNEGHVEVKKTINRKNFVIKCLESLNEIIIEEPDDIIESVVISFDKICALLKRKFGIELERTTDDPTIVK